MARERPILFNGEMTRAILSGAKVQTRRPMKPQPGPVPAHGPPVHQPKHSTPYFDAYRGGQIGASGRHSATGACWWTVDDRQGEGWVPAPVAVGDVLWVRENVYLSPVNFAAAGDCNATDRDGRRRLVGYVASMGADAKRQAADYGVKQTPSIHCPRWASRITLQVTDVRAERLLDVTEADAVAEGLTVLDAIRRKVPTVRDAFSLLWDDLYADSLPWSGSPWVWAITFRRVTP